jgi:hypothetical protein
MYSANGKAGVSTSLHESGKDFPNQTVFSDLMPHHRGLMPRTRPAMTLQGNREPGRWLSGKAVLHLS